MVEQLPVLRQLLGETPNEKFRDNGEPFDRHRTSVPNGKGNTVGTPATPFYFMEGGGRRRD
ncbi:MAG: hypothetical protein A2806_02355 [Candidatus Terrybacteria bacterium RIFCSPHIGHO2_01_FULL_48_17]|uniref:Uncharacterized protein n=1 Tax=Candidatus Terrybacteria bacterium RIFCSPHIGHO2_01_FULL_48_17 TaxID=1802362 RepID=A0A1G2PHQ0_9BACT|nr:MAG: hypothetical protein A2806_02355 [Candidatus Terrybacteria bacterium RIFCSPHIGHO2_01_FULL_48_17]OHA53584.1 MAG: hypothetical protein A3A30_00310 [Candidatus Terrybacteria bacterium RIFCSPLOWO2_01_FULL_48_14]